MTKVRSYVVERRPRWLPAQAHRVGFPLEFAAEVMLNFGVSPAWGQPVVASAWVDLDGNMLAMNAGYANGRTAHYRRFVRRRLLGLGKSWTLSFERDRDLLQSNTLEEA